MFAHLTVVVCAILLGRWHWPSAGRVATATAFGKVAAGEAARRLLLGRERCLVAVARAQLRNRVHGRKLMVAGTMCRGSRRERP